MALNELVFKALAATVATLGLVLGAASISANSMKSKQTMLTTETAPAAPQKSSAQERNSLPPSPVFTEVADQTGLDFHHYNGMTGQYYLPEIMGSGAALLDYDNDGDLDIFIVQGSVMDSKSK